MKNDLSRLSLRAASPAGAHRVDRAAGTLRRVSLITAGREARGHGVFVDARTLATFHALLAGRSLKAYATHGGPQDEDGTLGEIGLWGNFAVEGDRLAADFVALDAWRKHRPGEFDMLFELAEKAAGEFGASLNFRFNLVWPQAGGTEVPARRIPVADGWRYDPPRPAGAPHAQPSVRAVDVFSADFVDTPAANTGLFRAGAAPVRATEAQLRAELDAIKGTDAASAKRRGEIVARLRTLRAA